MEGLEPRLFAGEGDCDRLRDFMQSAVQYDGDTFWQFGKGLRGAYLDFFEFNEYMPLGYLWSSPSDGLAAASCICGKTGLIRYQSAPRHRGPDTTEAILAHAEGVLAVVSPDLRPWTLLFDHDPATAEMLSRRGYGRTRLRGVQLEHGLGEELLPRFVSDDFHFRALNTADPAEITAREDVQTRAFSDSDVFTVAWQHRNIGRSLAYVGADGVMELVGVDKAGRMVAFASIILDPQNGIGEIRPLGAARDEPMRDYLTAAITLEALHALREAGYRKAVAKLDIHDSGDLMQGVSAADQAIAQAGLLGFAATARLYEYAAA